MEDSLGYHGGSERDQFSYTSRIGRLHLKAHYLASSIYGTIFLSLYESWSDSSLERRLQRL